VCVGTTAARRLNTARALWFELPDTYSQLLTGELHERVADAVVSETRHLDAEKRRQVDEQLKATGISRMGFKAAPLVFARRPMRPIRRAMSSGGRTERKHRRVGIRPAPDTMAVLTGDLPVEQGIAATPHSAGPPAKCRAGRSPSSTPAPRHAP
jgi:hypothetical protein